MAKNTRKTPNIVLYIIGIYFYIYSILLLFILYIYIYIYIYIYNKIMENTYNIYKRNPVNNI